MSYCVNCGVELADSEKKCPLCGVEINNPLSPHDDNAKKPYPEYRHRAVARVSRKVKLEFISLIFLIPIALSLVCNISISGTVSWAGYAVGALTMLYLVVISPIVAGGIRRKTYGIAMTAVDFAAVLGFLYYIQRSTGGDWFSSFALPLMVSMAVMVLFIMAAGFFLHIDSLMLTALGMLLSGVQCVVIETLLNTAFGIRERLAWSLYPLTTAVIIGIILIFIDCKPALKEKLRKKFFI